MSYRSFKNKLRTEDTPFYIDIVIFNDPYFRMSLRKSKDSDKSLILECHQSFGKEIISALSGHSTYAYNRPPFQYLNYGCDGFEKTGYIYWSEFQKLIGYTGKNIVVHEKLLSKIEEYLKPKGSLNANYKFFSTMNMEDSVDPNSNEVQMTTYNCNESEKTHAPIFPFQM